MFIDTVEPTLLWEYLPERKMASVGLSIMQYLGKLAKKEGLSTISKKYGVPENYLKKNDEC